ncbi:unnamed protein product [Rotaria sp. Silwood1]|nr:unnamed protein product [Rotaria sp. Silwood1]CAF4771322.1 unnamed protein product [Rotaria sp. Silwood1]
MTTNNDTIVNTIHQLETLLFHDDTLNEIQSHPLINLRDQLQKIDDEWNSRTIDEYQKLMSILIYFEINSFYHFIKRYSSIIPSTLLTTLFDVIRFQMYINMAIYPESCDYYFDLSLTYLIDDSTINYIMDKKNILSNINEHFLNFFTSLGARSLYTKRRIAYSIYVSHKNIPTFFQLNNSTERLLQAFLTYLNNYFLNNHQQSHAYLSILNWIHNMADIYGFVPYFIKIGYPNAIIQWMLSEQDHTKNISLESWSSIISILYNLARHPIGVKELNELKMIDILQQWKERYMSETLLVDYNETNKEILIAYYLLYAALLKPKDLKKESISNIQTILDYILEQTMKAFDSNDLCFGSYNVCEYLDGLAKLIVNDTFLIYIISRENIYELLIEKFLLFNNICELTILNTTICSSLYTIFWSISFLSEYSIKLKSNDEYALDMKRAAKGILFNLDCLQIDIRSIEDNHNHNSDDNQIKVMISYSHQDMEFCKNLVKKIQERFQCDIWVDFNKLSPPYDDDWEEIAKAITENVTNKTDEEVMENLLKLITVRNQVKRNENKLDPSHRSHLKKISDIQLQSNSTVSDIIPISSIEEWTCEEVQQWLHLPLSTLQLSSGRALLTYMNLLSHDDAQYDEYEHRMRNHGVSQEQFSNLISLFASVRSLNDTETTSSKLPEQWTRIEIKYWFQQNHLSDDLLNVLNFIDGSQLIMYG